MIEFKKSVKKTLPYDRKQYLKYLADDFGSSTEWYGVAFKLPGANEASEGSKKDFIEYVGIYERLLKNVVLELDNGSFWIVNHADIDLKWFPNAANNLISLRTFFKQNNIPNEFKGALILNKEDLLKLSRDLISYPIAVFSKKGIFYRDLDISHSKLQFIIKISCHLCIDLLSTNKELLRKIVQENSTDAFNIKEYRGTSLW